MSTKCNIIVREEQDQRREIVLYQPSDGHPEAMVNYLKNSLEGIFIGFKERGDESWFVDPTKVSAMLVATSIPVITPEVQDLLGNVSTTCKNLISQIYDQKTPRILPDNGRSIVAEYEYVITLKEKYEDSKRVNGYQLEVHRTSRGKKMFLIKEEEVLVGQSADQKKNIVKGAEKSDKNAGVKSGETKSA